MTIIPPSFLDKAFNAYKTHPTPENAWELQKEIVAYAGKVKKEKRLRNLTTVRGGDWDKRLGQIVELFNSLNWTLSRYRTNEYLQTWKVRSGSDVAYLCLDSTGFSMTSGLVNGDRVPLPLQGKFAGYEDTDVFTDFLVANKIEVD